MQRTPRSAKVRSLADEVSHTFRAMILGTVLIIAGTAATMFWITQVYQPKSERLANTLSAVERTHVAMIDAETSLIAYLSVREDRYLDPYVRARPILDESVATLRGADLDAELTRAAVHFQVAHSAWYDEWATDALNLAFAGPSAAELAAFLDQGKERFDEYRTRESVLTEGLRDELDSTRQRQRVGLLVMFAFLVTVAAVTAVVTLRRRSRIRREVVQPVSALQVAVEAVAGGELTAPPPVAGPAEIQELQAGLARMTASLATSRQAAAQRQARTDHMAKRLAEVVEFARHISGTLAIDEVLDQVGRTVGRVTGARGVRVWLVDSGADDLRLVHDTRIPAGEGLSTEVRRIGVGLVGGSAQRGQVKHASGTGGLTSAAFPLIIGARVTGVVEVIDADCAPEELDELCQHVETLVSHAAAVIEAARLYQKSTELSTRDALTGLTNRRGFDEDLARETDLALRHARRLAFLMLDLDNFKQVNDSYGHQYGDQVLRELAGVLQREARQSEGVYRYGGEEFGLLLSEADAATAFGVAERLRAAVEEHFRRSGRRQTVSIGVASLPEHATGAEELVAAADSALYAAKRAGRNRVVVHRDSATSAGREVPVPSGPH